MGESQVWPSLVSHNQFMLLVDALPQLSNEIGRLLDQAGESQLSAQLEGLSIVDRCRCGDSFCSSFYTAPKPAGRYGNGHRCVSLDQASDGMIILDVVK
jgi:hypothetical protein